MRLVNPEKDKTRRPVPNTEEGYFLRQKTCSARIYIYLLLKSKRRPDGSENHRYVEKMTNTKIAQDLGISRGTVGTHMQTLKSRGYVEESGRYYLVPKGDYYSLIPEMTLNFLLNYVKGDDKLIKLYIVLFDYFNAEKDFIMLDLHRELGYSLSKDGKPISKNSKAIRTMLLILQGAGLIKYYIREGRNSKGAPIDIYTIISLKSNIDEQYCASYQRLVENGEIEIDEAELKAVYGE